MICEIQKELDKFIKEKGLLILQILSCSQWVARSWERIPEKMIAHTYPAYILPFSISYKQASTKLRMLFKTDLGLETVQPFL